jgi:hypothetical protein
LVQVTGVQTCALPIWRKTALDAIKESSVNDKMEIVNNFVHKNVSLVPENSGATPQAPLALLQSGQGSGLECATAKYYTLAEAGVPTGSMSVVTTDQGALLLVQDGQQVLAAGSDFVPGMPTVRNSATLPPDIKPQIGFNADTLFTYSAV